MSDQPMNGADASMVVRVTRVNIPAMSTVGYGWGTDYLGRPVKFAGGHREMRHLGEAIAESTQSGDDAPMATIEPWQILPND